MVFAPKRDPGVAVVRQTGKGASNASAEQKSDCRSLVAIQMRPSRPRVSFTNALEIAGFIWTDFWLVCKTSLTKSNA